MKTFLNLDEPALGARQMYLDWASEIGVSQHESRRAVRAGFTALDSYTAARRREARAILERLENERRIGIVLLARPYHNDPGINHGIPEALQALGYPVFTLDALPVDPGLLDALFCAEGACGGIPHPFSIDDVWKNSYSENGSRKLWAAKYTARHPNLIGIELSNFKCGHDAPIAATIEGIIEAAGKPFFYFREMDETAPSASHRIRIETIAYFLERYRIERTLLVAAPEAPALAAPAGETAVA